MTASSSLFPLLSSIPSFLLLFFSLCLILALLNWMVLCVDVKKVIPNFPSLFSTISSFSLEMEPAESEQSSEVTSFQRERYHAIQSVRHPHRQLSVSCSLNVSSRQLSVSDDLFLISHLSPCSVRSHDLDPVHLPMVPRQLHLGSLC